MSITSNNSTAANKWWYLSAYDIAVKHGYRGSVEQWLADVYGGAASAAQQAALAEEAKTGAENAKEDAEDARAAAETAKTQAQGYAAAAADSADTAETYLREIGTSASGAVADWLNEHIGDEATVGVTDSSLMTAGAAADAKAAGDGIRGLHYGVVQGLGSRANVGESTKAGVTFSSTGGVISLSAEAATGKVYLSVAANFDANASDSTNYSEATVDNNDFSWLEDGRRYRVRLNKTGTGAVYFYLYGKVDEISSHNVQLYYSTGDGEFVMTGKNSYTHGIAAKIFIASGATDIDCTVRPEILSGPEYVDVAQGYSISEIKPMRFTLGYYLVDGVPAEYGAGAISDPLNCENVAQISFKTSGSQVRYNYFYNSSGEVLGSVFVINASGTTVVDVPNGASYFMLSDSLPRLEKVSAKFNLSAEKLNPGSQWATPLRIRVMQNNLGDFDFGYSAPSGVANRDKMDNTLLAQKIANYKLFYDRFAPDILGLQEYADTVTAVDETGTPDSYSTRDELFDPRFAYNSFSAGDQTGPVVFSKLPITRVDKYAVTGTGMGTDHNTKSKTSYLAVATMSFRGKTYAIASGALYPTPGNTDSYTSDFDEQTYIGIRASQWETILDDKLGSYDNVILCMDMNTGTPSGHGGQDSDAENKNILAAAASRGYVAGNDSFFVGYPTYLNHANVKYHYFLPIDNIFIKGDVRLIDFRSLFEEVTDFPDDYVWPWEDETPDKSKSMFADRGGYNKLASDHIPVVADLLLY